MYQNLLLDETSFVNVMM